MILYMDHGQKADYFTILRLLEISPENMQHQGDFKILSVYQSRPTFLHLVDVHYRFNA